MTADKLIFMVRILTQSYKFYVLHHLQYGITSTTVQQLSIKVAFTKENLCCRIGLWVEEYALVTCKRKMISYLFRPSNCYQPVRQDPGWKWIRRCWGLLLARRRRLRGGRGHRSSQITRRYFRICGWSHISRQQTQSGKYFMIFQ